MCVCVCVFYEGNIYIFKLGVIVFCIWNGIWKWFSGTMWFLIGAWTSSRTFFIISIIKIPIIWSFFLTWSERMFPKKRLLGWVFFFFPMWHWSCKHLHTHLILWVAPEKWIKATLSSKANQRVNYWCSDLLIRAIHRLSGKGLLVIPRAVQDAFTIQ